MADKDDDLRGDIMAAIEESSQESANVQDSAQIDGEERASAVVDESTGKEDTRSRDELGRFAKAEAEKKAADDKPKTKAEAPKRETLTLKEKAPKQGSSPVIPPDAARASEAASPEDQRTPPPQEWAGGEKVRWERLPKEIQAAIRRDYDRMTQISQAAEPVMRSLEPARDLLVREGGSVEGGVNKLLQISQWASGQPADFALSFITQRGLNFPALAARLGFQVVPAQPGSQPYQAQPPALPAEILQRLQRVDQLEARIVGQQSAATQSQIEAFVNDPAHPYVADVQDEMIAHLELMKASGRPPDLKEAYDRAVWANPATRAQLMASQQTQGQPNQQAVAAARAAKAASLNGSPVPGTGSADLENEDLRSTIARHVYASVGGRRI